MNTSQTNNAFQRYEGLDGVRGIAIWLVLLAHNFGFVPAFLKTGWVGVDLFFVLSGFLITEILLKNTGKKHYFFNFYLKRAFRILPVYFLVFGAGMLITARIPFFSGSYSYYKEHLFFLLFYIQNWLPVFHPNGNPNLAFSHFWSLGIEEQFYLIFPTVVFFLRGGRRLSYLLIAAILFIITARFLAWLFIHDADLRFSLIYCTHYDGICVGAIIAVIRNSGGARLNRIFSRLFLGFLLCHLLIFLVIRIGRLEIPHFIILGYTSIALAFGWMVLKALDPGSLVYKIVNCRFLKFFALISYGLYLIHIPVFKIGKWYFKSVFPPDVHENFFYLFLLGVFTVAIATFLSYLSYRFFELPILKSRNRFLKSE